MSLYAVALEVDDVVATRLPDRVCSMCGGWGERIIGILHWPSPALVEYRSDPPMWLARPWPARLSSFDFRQGHSFRIVFEACPCDGPTHPATVSLHRTVISVDQLPRPLVTWPDEWLVEVDAMEAAGWQLTHLDPESSTLARRVSDDHARTLCTFWRVFRDWTIAGEEPNVAQLAEVLDWINRGTPVQRRLFADLPRFPPEFEHVLRQALRVAASRDHRLEPVDRWQLGSFFRSSTNGYIEAGFGLHTAVRTPGTTVECRFLDRDRTELELTAYCDDSMTEVFDVDYQVRIPW